MRPILLEKVWGGSKLVQVCQKDAGALDVHSVGESWEVADLKNGTSTVDGGPFSGQTLRSLVEEFGTDLTGEVDVDDEGVLRFPLLVKLIDTSADLSVQVHPGPDNAHLFDGAQSKDECWWVLSVDDGAQLAHGFNSDDVDRDAFAAALDDKKPEALLRFVDVTPSDSLHVSPGVVHAIGKGVLLLEVQEPSDTTFRVWDYERPGLDGKLRQLHVDQALQVLRYGSQPAAKVTPVVLVHDEKLCHQTVVNAPGYRLEHLATDVAQGIAFDKRAGTPVVVSATHTPVDVVVGDHAVALPAFGTAIIPACVPQFDVAFAAPGEVLLSGLGGDVLVEPSA